MCKNNTVFTHAREVAKHDAEFIVNIGARRRIFSAKWCVRGGRAAAAAAAAAMAAVVIAVSHSTVWLSRRDACVCCCRWARMTSDVIPDTAARRDSTATGRKEDCMSMPDGRADRPEGGRGGELHSVR